jgi:hypothetical protein
LQFRQLNHDARLWRKSSCATDEWLPIVAAELYWVRWISCQDRRDQVARGALPLRSGDANAPTAAEEAKCPLRLTNQHWSAGTTLSCQRDCSSGKVAEISLNSRTHGRKSERYGGAMDHKIGVSEERRQVLSITE